VWISTDNLACVQSMHRLGDWRTHQTSTIPSGTVSARSRIRSGARAYITTMRKVIEARRAMGAFTRIAWVRAHTGGDDACSRANDKADKLANAARRIRAAKPSAFMYNDERLLYYTLLHGDRGPPNYVAGDLRKALKRIVRVGQRRAWEACTGRQGIFPAECGSDILQYCSWLSRIESPELLRFAVLAALKQLPTPGRFFRRHARSKQLEFGSCPLCHHGAIADSVHAITCPWLGGLRNGVAKSIMITADPTGAGVSASVHPMFRVARAWVSQLRLASHIPAGRAELCARWFMENNPSGSRQQFAEAFEAVARPRTGSCVPDGLLDILREEFSLQVQAYTSAPYRDPSFPRWFSEDPADACFGAHAGFERQESWAGMFIWVDTCRETTAAIVDRFNNSTCIAPIRLLLYDRGHSLTIPRETIRHGRSCLYQTIFQGRNGTVRLFQNIAAAASAPVHWRRIVDRLAKLDLSSRARAGSCHRLPMHPLLYWADVDAATAPSAFMPPPGSLPATSKALEKQHCFSRTAALLGGQPEGLQVALRVVRPHMNTTQLERLTTALRRAALECSLRLYETYSSGLHAWVRDAATSGQLSGMLDITVPVPAPPAQSTSAWSDRLRDRDSIRERNRLARSSSAFPIVYPEDDEVINLPDEKLRRTLIRRWTLAKD
jgi:hypothetical protein